MERLGESWRGIVWMRRAPGDSVMRPGPGGVFGDDWSGSVMDWADRSGGSWSGCDLGRWGRSSSWR
jgi:hypothetical protein